MPKRATMSKQTRNNWLIDAALFVGAVLAATSGIYYLFVPILLKFVQSSHQGHQWPNL